MTRLLLIYSILVLFGCQSSFRIPNVYSKNKIDFDNSITEILENYTVINDKTTHYLDGSVGLRKSEVNQAIFSNLKSLRLLYQNENVLETKIISKDLIMFLLKRDNGYFNWDNYFIVYNSNHSGSNYFAKEQNESLTQFKRIKDSNWYELIVKMNLD